MFIGHFGVALAAKKLAPKTSLGTLFMSVQLTDLVWPVFLLLGLEHVRIDPGNTVMTPLDFYDYPITHSLVGVLAWSAVLGSSYFLVRRYRRGALVVAAAVTSHWILDALVHRPDLPVFPDGPYIGMGLWNSPWIEVVLELAIFLTGVFVYSRTTVARDRMGKWGFRSLSVVLVLIWSMAISGSPPSSERTIAIVGLVQWVFVWWAYRVDAHRQTRASTKEGT
jgi:membrane-bound metal-dependent hydrolase YbcI (DUF457 family)